MVVVTGLGAITALGEGIEVLFEALCQGESAINKVPFKGASGPAAVLGEEHTSNLALKACIEALKNASEPDRSNLLLCGASTSGEMRIGEEAFRKVLFNEPLQKQEDFIWEQLCHRPTELVSQYLNISGPALTLSTACTSGACAIGVATEMIEAGHSKVALVFGADALCKTTIYGFGSLGVNSKEGCRPFDVNRSGMTLGDGAAALVLEDLDHALERGAKPLAFVSGYGSASDAHHLTAPHPEGRGAISAIKAALGGVASENIDFVCAHATGTNLNDAMEALVINKVFPKAAVSGFKGSTGHTLGAAGALEAVITVMAIYNGIIPMTVRHEQIDPAFPSIDIVTHSRKANIENAISVNFAFGGNNSALLFSRYKS